MDSTKIKASLLLPTLNNNISKKYHQKKVRRAKFKLRQYSQFQNQKTNDKEQEKNEDQGLKQKVQTIKKKQRYRISTQAPQNQCPQTLQDAQYSPETPSIYEKQPSNAQRLGKIFRSLQKFKNQRSRLELKDQQTVKARVKSPLRKQRKQEKKPSHNLSKSIRRYKNNLSFDQKLAKKNMAKKIQQMKPSRQVSLLELNKEYEQHQAHVQLRENYLVVGNKKVKKRLFFG